LQITASRLDKSVKGASVLLSPLGAIAILLILEVTCNGSDGNGNSECVSLTLGHALEVAREFIGLVILDNRF